MSLSYLKEAIENNDSEKLIRYVRLHFGDGDEKKGAKEIDKAWGRGLKTDARTAGNGAGIYFQNSGRKG